MKSAANMKLRGVINMPDDITRILKDSDNCTDGV